MSWKKTDLERLKAASLTDRLRKSRSPDRYGRDAALIGWQKAFKLDEQAVAAVDNRGGSFTSGEVISSPSTLRVRTSLP